MSPRAWWGSGLAGLLLGVSGGVSAGSACTEQWLAVERFQDADALARLLHDALSRDVAEVAIVARVGSDLSRHGLRFSHAAFALRDSPGGSWRVVHLLNHCGQATGALYREGLINFFLDDPFEYAALVLVILTDQEGLCDKDPRHFADARLIHETPVNAPELEVMASGSGGALGRGGMLTKVRAARLAARSGSATVIAAGREERILLKVAEGEQGGMPVRLVEVERDSPERQGAVRQHRVAHVAQHTGPFRMPDHIAFRQAREAGDV